VNQVIGSFKTKAYQHNQGENAKVEDCRKKCPPV